MFGITVKFNPTKLDDDVHGLEKRLKGRAYTRFGLYRYDSENIQDNEK